MLNLSGEGGKQGGWRTCDAQAGTFMETSNTVAPQATEADFRGSCMQCWLPSQSCRA